MSKQTLIKVENVSKKYCRDLKRSLLYGLKDIARDISCTTRNQNYLRPHEFWALKNISFELKKGESIGLIGRNGSGKTTLLKMINGLIKPTNGKITIKGSIGALIALGTGFNPILTGRENVKIAGAVLGLSEKEINEKIDEILEFSEIGDFINAPVKSYSSGMLVRLGFSVAIQIKPDILLVDEVLAVGDLGFAIKCQKKITEYRNNGGAMILVSHGLHNIRFHCDKAMWLRDSQVELIGSSNDICNNYEIFTARHAAIKGQEIYQDNTINIKNVKYPKLLSSNEKFVFEFEAFSKRIIEKVIIVFSIYDVKGQHLISSYSNLDVFFPLFKKGSNIIRLMYNNIPLANGCYKINLAIHENEMNNFLVQMQGCYGFEIKNKKTTIGAMNIIPHWMMD